jgi:hypothetical protein
MLNRYTTLLGKTKDVLDDASSPDALSQQKSEHLAPSSPQGLAHWLAAVQDFTHQRSPSASPFG